MIATIWLKLQKFWIEIVALLVTLIFVFIIGYNKGGAHVQHEWDLATAKAYQKSQEEANVLASGIADNEAKHQTDLQSIVTQRDAAIASLQRDRAHRVSSAASAACKGTTGRELSIEDGEFLVGYAAAAASAAVSLTACYGREDEYRKAMIGNRKD